MNWIKVEDQEPPKDGSPFLCYDPNADEFGKIYVVLYDPGFIYTDPEFERCSRKHCYREASGECYFTWNPTYWMPLPKPPKGEYVKDHCTNLFVL
jgi:hypothetical protein